MGCGSLSASLLVVWSWWFPIYLLALKKRSTMPFAFVEFEYEGQNVASRQV